MAKKAVKKKAAKKPAKKRAARKAARKPKKVIALFPPNRNSDALRRVVNGRKWVSEADLRQSQLPPTVALGAGRIASRPPEWA